MIGARSTIGATMSARDPNTGSAITPAAAPADNRDTVTPDAAPELVTATSSPLPGAAPASDGTQVQAQVPTHLFSPSVLPEILGYTVLCEIARGGMGVVYSAHDPAFDREVAVKVMHPGQDATRFVVESKVTAQLPHPGVPPVYALGTLADGRPFLAMKLIRGNTLAEEFTTAELPRLLGIFEQICLTVGFAHSRGIVHRDLKPSNVMIGSFGEVQVMDWGLAKSVTGGPEDAPGPLDAGALAGIAQTVAGAVKGTPAFMAPEQARGEKVDARADVFALGGLLAVMLTGKPPFLGESVIDTVLKAAQAELSECFAQLNASGADEELVALAKRCLAAQAQDRPVGGQEVAAAVAAYRASVEERLQRAERERVAAEAKAAEELNTRREAEARAEAEQNTRREAEAREREQRKRRRAQLILAGVVTVVLAGAGIATNLVIEQRAQDKLEAEQKQGEERIAAEKKQSEERVKAEERRQTDLRAADTAALAKQRQTKADALVDALGTADTAGVPRLIGDLNDYRDLIGPKLRELAAQEVATKPGLHGRCALLADEAERATELAVYLPKCKPDELLTIRQLLTPHATAVAPVLWPVLLDPKAEAGRRLRAACALAGLTPADPRWETVAPEVADAVARATPGEFVVWSEALEPVRVSLLPALMKRYPEARARIESGNLGLSELVAEASRFDLTASLLSRYAADRPADLAELAVLVDGRHYPLFAQAMRTNKGEVIPALKAELEKKPKAGSPDAEIEAQAKRQGYAAAVLVALGEGEAVWSVFRFPKETGDPSARSYLLERLAGVGADPVALIRRFDAETDVSAKRSLLVTLGDFPLEVVPVGEREKLAERLLQLYREHPDPGLHGAIDWLLRQKWDKAKELTVIDAELAEVARGKVAARALKVAGQPFGEVVGPQLPAPVVAGGNKNWFVNGQGQTFAVVRGPGEFMIGSPLSEPGRTEGDEHQHLKQIPRSFAIATKAVTVEQFLRFQRDHDWTKRYSPGPDTPAVSMTWYQAAKYCNWLSEREGIPRDQWCYEPKAKGLYEEGMSMKKGHLGLTGYRLPTEAEWEYACRSGSATARYYGRGEGLLPRYAWFQKNSEDRAWPVGRLRPNDLGLFDALGNVWQWCEDPGLYYDTDQKEDKENQKYVLIDERMSRLLRGGSFYYQPVNLRSAYRVSNRPGNRDFTFGFRPVRTLLD
jgi:formylglycine-generating enzyme required for sulfatase activity